MILRHSRIPVDGQPVENTFYAMDERSGDILGKSVIYVERNPVLYPVRPLQVRVQLNSSKVPDQLLGATITRARQICALSGEYGRVYAHCAPDDAALMERLSPFGFQDTDGLVRMQLRLPVPHITKTPAGCPVIYDDLSDPLEKKYFLERYNQLFNADHDVEWLNQFIDRPNFTRIVVVSADGMAGEILTWRDQYSGVIGFIQTSKRWRRLGVASFMISLACELFEQMDLYCAECSVRVRHPHMLKLMTKAGFKQTELLMRYPGFDVNQ